MRFAKSAIAQAIAAGATWATWNPSDKDADVTLAGGNLVVTVSGMGQVRATQGKTTGTWYYEVTLSGTAGSFNPRLGWSRSTDNLGNAPGDSSVSFAWDTADGNVYSSGVSQGVAATATSGDVCSITYNAATGTATFRKNNSIVFGPTALVAGGNLYHPAIGATGSTGRTLTTNFGASTFAYTPPGGSSGVFI